MRIRYFTHSLVSCWNHGNAHFLRGVLDDLTRRGHEVRVFEPDNAWSLKNLLADHGEGGLDVFRTHYPALSSTPLRPGEELGPLVDAADLVVVHEWNDPKLVATLGRLRKQGARFTLLFHDTHHRAVSAPEEMARFDLSGYDGVLAFGEALTEVYRRQGWGSRVWTWHEAADIRRFHPPTVEIERQGLVWIGNWGDGERSGEIESYLLAPAQAAGLPLTVYGVRYPAAALQRLARYRAVYQGWAANPRVRTIFARFLATVHVPRRFYASHLPGIPTIRVFEALACGIPLACAPWTDSEGLFRPGTDYLIARDGAEMTRHLRALNEDAGLRRELAASGLESIRARHTCGHRVEELLAIVERISAPRRREAAA